MSFSSSTPNPSFSGPVPTAAEPFQIIAEWADNAKPRYPGPWTRDTHHSAIRFVDHNIGDRHDEGLLKLTVYEWREGGRTVEVYSATRRIT